MNTTLTGKGGGRQWVMSEDEILIIKWLNSDDSDEWRTNTFMPLYRPLVSVVNDGNPSCLMNFRTIWGTS